MINRPDDAARINRVNDDVGVKWLISFLSTDKKVSRPADSQTNQCTLHLVTYFSELIRVSCYRI